VRPRHLRETATAAAAVILASGLVGGLTLAPASATPRGGGVRPAHIYAPYFEAYLRGSIAAATEKAGAKFATIAFLQAAGKKHAAACTLTWNGVRSQPISKHGYRFGLRALRARGGDAIASFGGYSADEDGTEIADSCHSVKAIAAAYEQLVTIYGFHRLDMDIEANSLTNKKGINRRDKAITLLESWARARHIPLWIQFTLGVEPNGFDQPTMAILRNAIKNRTKVNSINLMVFDYYLGTEKKPLHMAALAIESAKTVHRQLKGIYRHLSGRQIWRMLGFTMLPGIDDYPGKTEVTHLSNARVIMDFARSRGMDFLSIWALQRDNGHCPGAIDSNTCSGIKQPRWAFSHLLERFTS
jgi:hypothetical protein